MLTLDRLPDEAASYLIGIDRIDICVVVPKADEFRAHLEVFGIASRIDDLPSLKSEDRYKFAVVDLNGLKVALVFMNNQGNTASGICARECLNLLSPSHLYLSGTSLGNKNRTGIGSVRVAERVQHAAEWVTNSDGQRVPRWSHYSVPSPVRRDLGSFLNEFDSAKIVQVVTASLQGSFPQNWQDVLSASRIDHEMTPIVSDNDLMRDNGEKIWNYDERFASYDMESGGFGGALDGESSVSWAVIRGISDFGTNKTAAEGGYRILAATAAAAFLREFLRNGLSRSHPLVSRPAQSPVARLSPNQHYNLFSASDFFSTRLREDLGVDLPVHFLNRQATLDDLATYCVSAGLERDAVASYLRDLRVHYFEGKYVDYSYDIDIRGYWEDSWFQEFREFIALWGRESLSKSNIVDVGAGNGLELPILFSGARHLAAVDLSEKMLNQARQRFDGLRVVRAEAENLHSIETNSIDMYVSLRTYMSRFFDPQRALREAWRVLKPGGLVVLSVAAGYLDSIDGKPTVVRGLKEVDGSEFVDENRPLSLGAGFYRQLNAFGFTQVYISSRLTDVYVGALKPGNLVPSSPRIGPGMTSMWQ